MCKHYMHAWQSVTVAAVTVKEIYKIRFLLYYTRDIIGTEGVRDTSEH